MAVRIAREFLRLWPLLLAGFLPARAADFYHDIEPILSGHCAPCHHAGAPGPFSLVTYQDARKHATEIAAVTTRRYMPPWLPEPGYGEFRDERRLTDIQIRTIQEWVRSGAPEGTPQTGKLRQEFASGWLLGQPDLVITASKPFSIPADGPDVFWNFILPSGVRETHYVEALEIVPGNPRAVHHANLLVDRARSARRRESAAGTGFPGMDVTLETETFDPDSHFLFWKPGGVPWREPAGMAWRLDPGDDLILNAHLRPTGKVEAVQPSIGIYLTREAPSKFPMLIQLEHDGALDIPPGERDFVVTDEFRMPVDADVLAVYPHAHYLGKLLEGYATLPDGAHQWLIRIPEWDMNWQSVYRLRKPLFLPKGSVVSMRFHYDNSADNPRNPNSPPKQVRGGNQASDEMAHLWLQVLPRGGGDQRPALQEALMRRRLEKYPRDFLAHFNLGALFLNRQDTAAALDHLREAVRIEPENPAPLNTLGVALVAAGRPAEALNWFRHVLFLRPDDAAARYNLAGVLIEQGQVDLAAAELRKLLAKSPEDRKARARLISLLKDFGDRAAAESRVPEATACYRELVTFEPADPDLRNNLGILLARAGDFPGAISQFETALKINPDHEAARRNLEIARRKVAH